ncbi:MAG: hypothetical protein J0M18_10150 [Ignavibacteria bacterium]|nr:hypothetical protein [Ignavibacteria bacterium]
MEKVILSDGEEVYFETDIGGLNPQGISENIQVSLKKVTELGGKVLKETVENLKESLQSIKPDELEIEVGLTVGGEASVVFTKGNTEANIKIKATWKSKDSQ